MARKNLTIVITAAKNGKNLFNDLEEYSPQDDHVTTIDDLFAMAVDRITDSDPEARPDRIVVLDGDRLQEEELDLAEVEEKGVAIGDLVLAGKTYREYYGRTVLSITKGLP